MESKSTTLSLTQRTLKNLREDQGADRVEFAMDAENDSAASETKESDESLDRAHGLSERIDAASGVFDPPEVREDVSTISEGSGLFLPPTPSFSDGPWESRRNRGFLAGMSLPRSVEVRRGEEEQETITAGSFPRIRIRLKTNRVSFSTHMSWMNSDGSLYFHGRDPIPLLAPIDSGEIKSRSFRSPGFSLKDAVSVDDGGSSFPIVFIPHEEEFWVHLTPRVIHELREYRFEQNRGALVLELWEGRGDVNEMIGIVSVPFLHTVASFITSRRRVQEFNVESNPWPIRNPIQGTSVGLLYFSLAAELIGEFPRSAHPSFPSGPLSHVEEIDRSGVMAKRDVEAATVGVDGVAKAGVERDSLLFLVSIDQFSAKEPFRKESMARIEVAFSPPIWRRSSGDPIPFIVSTPLRACDDAIASFGFETFFIVSKTPSLVRRMERSLMQFRLFIRQEQEREVASGKFSIASLISQRKEKLSSPLTLSLKNGRAFGSLHLNVFATRAPSALCRTPMYLVSDMEAFPSLTLPPETFSSPPVSDLTKAMASLSSEKDSKEAVVQEKDSKEVLTSEKHFGTPLTSGKKLNVSADSPRQPTHSVEDTIVVTIDRAAHLPVAAKIAVGFAVMRREDALRRVNPSSTLGRFPLAAVSADCSSSPVFSRSISIRFSELGMIEAVSKNVLAVELYDSDGRIGLSIVDLRPLLFGFREIYGWYHLLGSSSGQVLVRVKPDDVTALTLSKNESYSEETFSWLPDIIVDPQRNV